MPRPIPIFKNESSENPNSVPMTASEQSDSGPGQIVIPNPSEEVSHDDITQTDSADGSSHSGMSPMTKFAQNFPTRAETRQFLGNLGRKGMSSSNVKIRPRQLPTESRGRISRSTAQAAGIQPPSLQDAEQNLKMARKK